MRLIRLDPNKVQLGKTYLHSSGRKFLAFHYVSNGVELEVELLEQIPDGLTNKHYMTKTDFEQRIVSRSFVRQD